MKRRITILLCLILSLTANAFSQRAEAPAQVAKTFLESLLAQEIESAQKTIDERFTGATSDRLKLEAAFFKNRKLKFIELMTEKIDDHSAQIEFRLTGKNKHEIECRMVFYKNPDLKEWKIIYWSFVAASPETKEIQRRNQPKTKIPLNAPPLVTDPPVNNPNSVKNGD